jgi:hypothetical protein
MSSLADSLYLNVLASHGHQKPEPLIVQPSFAARGHAEDVLAGSITMLRAFASGNAE